MIERTPMPSKMALRDRAARQEISLHALRSARLQAARGRVDALRRAQLRERQARELRLAQATARLATAAAICQGRVERRCGKDAVFTLGG